MDKRAIVIEDAAAFLSSWLDGRRPVVGIILGSGLGELANEIEDAITIPYIMVPGFPAATAVGHKGNFICGSPFIRKSFHLSYLFADYSLSICSVLNLCLYIKGCSL
ncbi:MAG: hypothetical protein II047_10555, partial [Bacteroidales bacterium]|nr:hypothetical protein [Bacteroidales bacterium]